MCYKPDYMILATATYHTDIKLWGFLEGDINYVGLLKGHIAMVTAVANL